MDNPSLPEEREAIKAAKRFLRSGPDRVATAERTRDVSPTETALAGALAVVYIRQDGWMLAVRKEHQKHAEATWKGEWIGRLDRVVIGVSPSRKQVFKLTVFSQQGFEYEACVFNLDGTLELCESGKAIAGESSPRGMSLGELRDMLRFHPDSIQQERRWCESSIPQETHKVRGDEGEIKVYTIHTLAHDLWHTLSWDLELKGVRTLGDLATTIKQQRPEAEDWVLDRGDRPDIRVGCVLRDVPNTTVIWERNVVRVESKTSKGVGGRYHM